MMNKKWVLCPVPAYDVEGMESWLGEMEGREIGRAHV